MKRFWRIFLGSGSEYLQECLNENYVGVDYGFHTSLSPYLAETWSESRDKIKPIYNNFNPNKSAVGAGLSCGALWTFAKGIQKGDFIFCPDKDGNYVYGEMEGDYEYVDGANLPHRRRINWLSGTFNKNDLSSEFKIAVGKPLTVMEFSKYQDEINKLVGNSSTTTIFSKDESIEDPTEFALESHLEDFLVYNWTQTELGKKYDLVSEDGVVIAQQYPCDTGRIDILAISKDAKEYLVVELKKGRTSDSVVGQTLRYMGFVKRELATNGENVRGVVIALEDDLRLKNALSMVPEINFYRYQIDFKLKPND